MKLFPLIVNEDIMAG